MKQIVSTTILLLHLFLVSCSDNPAGAASQDEPVFSVEVKNEDDHLDLQSEEDITTIDIESPIGIGSASFTLDSGEMPRQIIARLHLKGLEEFRLISSPVSVFASVPSSDGMNAQIQTKTSGTSELPMDPLDPLWLKVEIVSRSQDIPLQDGYFEITIPQEFLTQAGNSFEIQWIDFYR